jgi:hypothetical protein
MIVVRVRKAQKWLARRSIYAAADAASGDMFRTDAHPVTSSGKFVQ